MSEAEASPPEGPVLEEAEAVLGASGLLRNPYLQALEDGSLSLGGFRASQEQFYFAVSFFPRPMAALVGRIPDPVRRLDILRNLVEEHGDFDVRAFHRSTFQAFLGSLGTDAGALESRPPAPGLRAFNSVLTASCVLDEMEVGVACMGMIELAFSGISGRIGRAVVRRGWVRREELVHYALHARIDRRHAAEFFAVLDPLWESPGRRYYIRQGLELGAHAFDRLYRDLLELAGRAPD